MLTLPTQEELDKLKAAAEAATPGRWMHLFGDRFVYDRMEDGCRGNIIVGCDFGHTKQEIRNLDYIAAANPAKILAMLALIDAQKKQIAEMAAKLVEQDAQLQARWP